MPTVEELQQMEKDQREAEQNGNGGHLKSVEDITSAGGPEDFEQEEQPTLFGTVENLSTSIGRRKPTESAVKIKARAEKIVGQFDPDETVELKIRVRVDKVELVYVRDSDGDIMAVKRIHHLSPLHVERAERVEETG